MLTLLIRRNGTIVVTIVVFFCYGYFFINTVKQIESIETLGTVIKDELSDSLSKYQYTILVISGPDNEARRDAIRTTWGRFTKNIFIENGDVSYNWNHTSTRQSSRNNNVKMLFVLGTQNLSDSTMSKLKSEKSRSNDLLLFDTFIDTYETLTTKMLYSLKWISTNMRGMKYMIKCDDDSFVRVDLIIKELEAYAPYMNDPAISQYVSFKKNLASYKGLYWGYFDGVAKVFSTGIWKEENWFLCNNYLPYAFGGGYILSRSIVDYIARNSDFLSLYNAEDVSMGLWTASLDSINRVHDIRFDTKSASRGCINFMLILHKRSEQDMFELYETLIRTHGQELCNIEISESKSYVYNWNVLPKYCCTWLVD